MTTRDEMPEHPRCSCGRKLVIVVNGRPVHLDEWLARRPTDDDRIWPTPTTTQPGDRD